MLNVGSNDYSLQRISSVEPSDHRQKEPIAVDSAACRRMRDTRACRSKPMEVAGINVFLLEGYPFVETSLLQKNVEKSTNCRLEEVTLQTERPNCTISSLIGDIPGAPSGSLHHNLVKLVWENTWKETKPCQFRLVEQGLRVRFNDSNSTSFRVRDPRKQLDFI